MKKILVLMVFFVNLMPYMDKGYIQWNTGSLLAQAWGKETVCDDPWGESYASWTGSCDDMGACACDYCNQQIECDSYCSCESNNNDLDKGEYCVCTTCHSSYECMGPHSCSTGGNNNSGGSGGSSGGGGGGGSSNSAKLKTGFVSSQCEAYSAIWNNTFLNNKTKESAGYYLADGNYYLLDNTNNAADKTSWTETVTINDKNGNPYPGVYIKVSEDEYSQVKATIHSHPSADTTLFQGPTIYTDGRQDDYTHLEQFGGKQYPGEIVGYILSQDSIYKYYFTKDGDKKYETVGNRTTLSNCK